MAKVTLGDIVACVKDKVDKDSTYLEYYLGGEHFDCGEVCIKRKGIIRGSTIGPAFHMRFQPGDVLLMSRNPHLRKAAMVDFEGVCSNVSYVCRTKDETILPQKFLPFLFQTDDFWDFAERNKKGSTNFFLNWSDFCRYEVDLPPVETLRKFADLLWAAEKTKQAYAELLDKSDALVKSQFVEMFGSPEEVESSSSHIGDVADVHVGIVIKPTRFYASDASGIKAFRSLNVGPMYVQDGDWVYFTQEAMSQNMRTIAHTGDVLIVRSGAPGTSCVVTEDYDGCNVIDLIIAHPNTQKVLPEYLCAFTNFPHGKNQIENQQRGVAQKHFNVGMYKNLHLLLPPMEKQREFVDFLKQIDKSKFELKQAIEDVKATMKALILTNFNFTNKED